MIVYERRPPMCKYNFYYDESEHSRKINHKTITADNYFDNFIAVFVGWRSEDQADFYRKYDSFEKNIRIGSRKTN
jgi:hypothetical protein